MFIKSINYADNEITQREKNLFKLPIDKFGKVLILELVKLTKHCNRKREYQVIALKVFIKLTALPLYRQSKR